MGKPCRTAAARPFLSRADSRPCDRECAVGLWPTTMAASTSSGRAAQEGEHLFGVGPVEVLVEARLGRIGHVGQHELGRGRRAGGRRDQGDPGPRDALQGRPEPFARAGEEAPEGGGVAPAPRGEHAVEVGAAGRRVGHRLGVTQQPQGASRPAPSGGISPGRRPHAGCARPARRRLRHTMHEVRMVEVEIMSMLISSLASVSNMVAAIPGCDFMPTPTRETRATSASAVTPVAPSSSAWACEVSTATAQVGRRAR